MDEALTREIRKSFPEGSPPNRPVTAHRCRECDEVDRLIGARLWPDVATSFPDYCCDTFPLLTTPAQIYYLPAYLEHSSRNLGSVASSSVAVALEHGDLPREAFTEEQQRVIGRWLELYL